MQVELTGTLFPCFNFLVQNIIICSYLIVNAFTIVTSNLIRRYLSNHLQGFTKSKFLKISIIPKSNVVVIDQVSNVQDRLQGIYIVHKSKCSAV